MLDKRDTVSIFPGTSRLLDRTVEPEPVALCRRCRAGPLHPVATLSEANVRLPRAETIARIAVRNNVSIDWLLGLAQSDRVGTDILRQLEIQSGERSEVDELLARWHREAAGYKIRYVPMSLPDLLKTDAVIEL